MVALKDQSDENSLFSLPTDCTFSVQYTFQVNLNWDIVHLEDSFSQFY